ncbi:ATP-binding protein [Maricaulis parjimensis]|uniref:ATP-binding protein n=1 Tax=Maricaulis parjimensis TaxID=144023 RepID=UPI001939299A|nr:ATP-binding protein [Maricaulis parjimensis]
MSRDDQDNRPKGDGDRPQTASASDRAGPVFLHPRGEAPQRLDDILLTALDATGELILVRGFGGRVLYVNAAFLKAFGGERGDWIGRWFSVAPPVSDAESRRYEMLMRTRSGPLWIEWDERLLPDEAGVISVGRDVTHRREAHEDMEASQKAKSLFFAAVTHELRTPLAGTLGVARLLDATPLRPDQADYVRSIALSAEHALAMVDDILDLSRLEAGKLDLRPEELDVTELVRDTVELAAPRAQEKGLEIGVVCAEGAPQRILGDAARIKQILFNLIGNAVKFTASGGVRVDIANAPDAEGKPRLALSVSDTGPGISEADQENLFEHFERGAAERNGSESGAGLGLAMVRRLVEAMDSQMGVESRLGEGAKFWVVFELPVLEQVADRPLEGRALAIAAHSRVLQISLRDQLQALGASIHLVTPETPADDLKGCDLLLDASWTGPDLAASARRVWHLVTPAEKNQVLTDRAGADDGWFVKPVRAATLAQHLAPAGSPVDKKAPAPVRRPAFQPDVSDLCLLVAEDDPVNALIARKSLENLGITVTLVTDGESALEALAVQEFDAALLDQRMPGLDGPDVAREARRRGQRLPLIALTANASEADRKLCLEAGMDEFLSKPLDPDRLTQILLNLCRTENRASMG